MEIRTNEGGGSMIETQILICDDEAAVREVISVVLGMVGYHVETAADGTEALQKIFRDADRYKLVLTDHKMPGIDGLELVKQLRNGGFEGKIIVLSGRIDEEDIAAYTGLGVDGIMHKPFDFSDLRNTVSRVLSQNPDKKTPLNIAWMQSERLSEAACFEHRKTVNK